MIFKDRQKSVLLFLKNIFRVGIYIFVLLWYNIHNYMRVRARKGKVKE